MEETEPGRSNTKEASCAWLVSVFPFEFFLMTIFGRTNGCCKYWSVCSYKCMKGSECFPYMFLLGLCPYVISPLKTALSQPYSFREF